MMHQTGSYDYLQGTGFQAVRIPYGSGRLSMLAILPDPGTDLNTFVAGITAESLGNWITQLQISYGTIALPRFTATFGAPLSGALTTLGMGVAFCPNPANFSGIGALTCIADVEHKTVVEVNETGTTAAGATTGTVGITAVQAPQYTMTMNHPFFYAIRDDKTGALVFIGVLQDPNALN
jgi:serine protease inhibitor